MTLDQFNSLSEAEKREMLFRCCGSSAWSAKLAKNNFTSIDELKQASDNVWNSLPEKEWREAFSHHPRIGDVDSLKEKFKSTAAWAAGEQSAVNEAAPQVIEELKNLNDAYGNKFGYIFIVCATGKSADEMLAMLKKRLINNPAFEIRVAAEEQNKITHLRLDKLFA